MGTLPAVKVGQLVVQGDSTLRSNPILIQITTAVGPFRFHRIHVVEKTNL